MKGTAAIAAIATVLLLLTAGARAHIGSPNVFFEGQAGPHSVRVTIRPPATVPGAAQVEVRVAGEGADAVSLEAAPWEAGEAATATPTRATPVAGDAGLFQAPLWLLARGSYRVRVAVSGPRGRGSVFVPLHSAAIAPPAMPLALGAALALAGGALFAGAVAIARAAGRQAGVAVALLCTLAVAGGALRWRAMDRNFRDRALAKPVPVEARLFTAGALRLLRIVPSAGSTEPGWNTLVTDHGKLMHLFLCREPDVAAFAHLHPVRRDAAAFETVLPALPAGTYQLYGEITHDDGLSQTLVSRFHLPASPTATPPPIAAWRIENDVWCQTPALIGDQAPQPVALDADDSWHLGAPPPPGDESRPLLCALADGATMLFVNAGHLAADRETSLRFQVVTLAGRRATLQSYMGMAGHAVVRRSDGAVFTHLHPAGSISMAAQQMLAQRGLPTDAAPAPMPSVEADEISFPYAFPRPGDYRIWMQVRTGGRIQTGVFDVRVSPAAPR